MRRLFDGRFLTRGFLTSLALILVGLVTRAIFDKLLALSPDWTLVAHWAQAMSLYDLTAAVTLCGVGQGLTVFAARKGESEAGLMRDALIWGLMVSGGAALVLLVAAPSINSLLGREVAPAGGVGALAVIGGLLATAPGLFFCFWQGRGQRGKMLLLSLAGWAPMALAAAGLFGPRSLSELLWVVLATQAVLALALATKFLRRAPGEVREPLPSWRNSGLRRYILPGLSIGVLSPASVMWSRAELASGLSWNEVAQLQALWRTSEWVMGFAGGFLVLIFLPRMAAATGREKFHEELAGTWRALCLPAALVLAALWASLSVVTPLLYSERFLMPATASALFLTGDALRLASWVPLQGLFATERVHAVAIGEWLSLPLFAFLLTCVAHPSLEIAGACYAFTYVVYFAFNTYCIFRVQGRYASPQLQMATSD